MAQYPIKMLKDENGTPFVPLVAPEAVKDSQGTDLQSILDTKLEKGNIIAGSNITLSVSGNNITINSTAGGATTNIIDNLNQSTGGVGVLDAHQGYVLKGMIPGVQNTLTSTSTTDALSAYQGYLLSNRSVPTGGTANQVLAKNSVTDNDLKWVSLAGVATSGNYADLSGKPTIPTVTDNVTSTSTTSALSANQGKLLNDKFDELGVKVGTSVDNNYRTNIIKGKNLYIPVTSVNGTAVLIHDASVSLSNDEYTFTATGTDLYFGQIVFSGNSYNIDKGYLVNVDNMSSVSITLTGSAFNSIFITAYNSSRISLGYQYFGTNTVTYTLPSGCKYITIRIGVRNSVSGTTYKTKVMINSGSTALPYEPYVTPTINVDGETIYTKGQNEEYSGSETRIGTWIDGKPLYRKVINTISPSNEIGRIYNASSLNIDNIINMYCVISSSSGNTRLKVKLPYYYADNDAGTIWLEGDNITLRLTGSIYRGQSTILFLEYTKTTD